MIKVSPGHEGSVYADLQKRAEVREVYPLFGEYSFFLVVQAREKTTLGSLIDEIRSEVPVLKSGPILLTRGRQDRDALSKGPASTRG